MIRTNTIITLENNEQYLVLNETSYQDGHYFLVMGIDKNKEVISSKVAIFKGYNKDGIYIEKIEDSNLIMELTKQMKSQVL